MKAILAVVMADAGNLEGDARLPEEHTAPCGLGYIATHLNRNGHDCCIIDGQVNRLSPEALLRAILAEHPDVVGLTGYTFDRFNVLRLADLLKKELPDLIVVLGGPHFGQTAGDVLEHRKSVDYVIQGEGEHALCALLDHLQRGGSVGQVEGLWYRRKGVIASNPTRRLTADEIPDIDWSLFEVEKYLSSGGGGRSKEKAIGISTSRGCPNRCVYCYNTACWGPKVVLIPPRRVVDQIELLHRRYGCENFDFVDDTFTLYRKHVLEICGEISRRRLPIKWSAKARIDSVDSALLKAMKSSGCVRIFFGVESGSQRVLNRIHKKLDLSRTIPALRRTAELGLAVTAFFIDSLPGESFADRRKTYRLIEKIRSLPGEVEIQLFLCVVFPATGLEALAKREGIMAPDFSWNRPVYHGIHKRLGLRPALIYYHDRHVPLWLVLLHRWICLYGLAGTAKRVGKELRKHARRPGRSAGRPNRCASSIN